MDAPQNPHWLTYLAGGLGLLNLVQSVGMVFRREAKDEHKAVLARLDAVERKTERLDERVQGTERRFSEIMAELAKLPSLHVTVATVATDVKHLGAGIIEIKKSLTQLKNPPTP